MFNVSALPFIFTIVIWQNLSKMLEYLKLHDKHLSLMLYSMVSSLSVYVCTVKELQVSSRCIQCKDCSIACIRIINVFFFFLCVLAVFRMVLLIWCMI